MLTGGNVSGVSRFGNTLRMKLKRDNSKVQKLLKHLTCAKLSISFVCNDGLTKMREIIFNIR